MFMEGQGNQQVLDRWGGNNYMWYQYLTQKDIIVVLSTTEGPEGKRI